MQHSSVQHRKSRIASITGIATVVLGMAGIIAMAPLNNAIAAEKNWHTVKSGWFNTIYEGTGKNKKVKESAADRAFDDAYLKATATCILEGKDVGTISRVSNFPRKVGSVYFVQAEMKFNCYKAPKKKSK